MSSEEDDVLSMSDDLGNDEAEPDDNDDNINIYSSDSSPHNSFKHFSREHPFITSRHSVLPNLPKELELRPTSTGGLNQPQQTFISVCARTDLKLGTIFGPYQGKIRKDPISTSFNWKVTDRTATFTAWLELLDFNSIQWITCMRKADYANQRNAILLLFRGQLYIELTHEVNKGTELQLLSTEVLLIHEDPNGKRDKAEGSLLNDLFVSTASSLSNCGPLFEALSPNKLFNFSNPINNKSEIVSTLNESNETSSKGPPNNQNSRLEDAHPSSSSDATIKCSLCDNHFTDQLRLNEHVLFSHCNEDSGGGEREYKCNQCPKVFNWKSNLIRHQVAHDDSRRYTCENCKKVFTDPSNLQRHIRSQHIGARSHACPDCGKTFATSSGLKQHTHIHSSVKPFRCEVCFKAYTQFSNLCRHKRMHATCRLQIKCNKCGQAFSTVTSLSKHKRFCEGTSPSSNASLSPSSRNVNHINLNLSPNLSSPDSSVRKDSHISSLDITSPLNHSNPNPFLVYSRPGFPFYPPFFSSSFPSIFPGSGTAISPASSGTIVNTNKSLNHNNQLSSDSFSLSNKQQIPETDFIKNSKDFEVKKSEKNSLTDSLPLESNRKIEKQEVVSNSSESLVTDSEQSDLEEESEEEVAVTGDSDTEDEQQIDIKPKEIIIKKETNSSKTESDLSVTENIMSNNRESSPKQGSVCPEQMISSNGFIRPLSMMVDHLHSDIPFDLSRNNNKSHRRLHEDSPEFKSKIRDDSSDEPLDLTIKHKKENLSSHLMAPNNYGELFARHRAMFMAESMQSREEKRSHSPTGHMYNHHKLNEHFQRPLSPSKLMAYPRPIHPMILESMYRMQQMEHHNKPPNTTAFPLFGDPQRLSAAFPAFPPRYPPMLSPALLGTPAAQATFDFMRAHMNDKMKPQSEMMSPQMIKAKERYTCKFCGKVFPRSANLTRHLRTHTGEQPYKCKYCERSFSISSNLQRHVRNIHNKEKPFKCPLCDRCFGQQTNLDRHLKKHESDGPTILDDSPKIESDKDNGDTYFNEIRTFMGKVTDRSISDKSIRSMISPNCNNEKVYSPKNNGTNDENEIIADEESDIDESLPKKSRLHSDTSSIIEDDVVMSEDNEDADSVTDEESSAIPSENGNSRTSPSRSPPVGTRTRANISSVVACLSKKAQQKLNGLNGCGKSDEENKSENGLALTAGH